MRSIIIVPALCLAVGSLAGCTQNPPGPTKEVRVPSGGPPVLTKEELAAAKAEAYSTSAVAQASFEDSAPAPAEPEPIAEPRMFRPRELWTEQEAAADALGRIGAAAVPALVETLANPDPAVRVKAVNVLGQMGPDAAAAVPALIRLLDDPDPEVRKSAARTLGQIGPAAEEAVPQLMQTLLRPSP